jgi:hypothetical protein
MSSLKDIMDVDVEPLQSQAYRKAKEAAENTSSAFVDQSSPGTSPLDNPEETSTKRRRPNRAPRFASHDMPSWPSGIQPHSSSIGEPMGFQSAYRAGSSELASTPGSTHQSSPRGSESRPDVKYTRVTHRISKAKKGVRIHTCDVCNPPKVSPLI